MSAQSVNGPGTAHRGTPMAASAKVSGTDTIPKSPWPPKDAQGEESIPCTALPDCYFIFLRAWDVRADGRQFVSQRMYSDRSGEQAKMPPLRGIRSLKCHSSILGSQLEIPATASCSLC